MHSIIIRNNKHGKKAKVANHVVSMIAWVHGFPDLVKSFISFVILCQISRRIVQKTLIFFCRRLYQSFSSVCCIFPDYLDQLKKKNGKFSAIGYTLQLVEVIWKTAANPGEFFTQFYAEKYEGFFALRLSITKVMNEFSYP